MTIKSEEKPARKKAKRNINTEKNARRLELIQKKLDAGLLSEKFPEISSVTIHVIQFYGMTGPVFMERTINMVPGSNIYLLHMPCMGEKCVNGGFDLTSKVEDLVRNNRKSGKGKMLCQVTDASGASHASISYDISIKYS
ncbi:MAG: hypothetical protein M0033_04205 [Nitrospiraceae bacterium]|nr:hypothetical protein [Nitrospiraceae bacterium]MDA8325402.1 hypothetical protein [Nitrospiraceae bacterium]